MYVVIGSRRTPQSFEDYTDDIVRNGWRNSEKLPLGASTLDRRKFTAAMHATGESAHFRLLSSCARTSGPFHSTFFPFVFCSASSQAVLTVVPLFLLFVAQWTPAHTFSVSSVVKMQSLTWVCQITIFCTVIIAFPLRHLPWWWWLHSVL